jgi:hypothetical protein
MIFLIYGLYPSYLITIHNSNCDNRAIPHLLSISIVAIRICPSIHPSIHPYSCLPPIRHHWCSCFPSRTTLAPNYLIGMVMSFSGAQSLRPARTYWGPYPSSSGQHLEFIPWQPDQPGSSVSRDSSSSLRGPPHVGLAKRSRTNRKCRHLFPLPGCIGPKPRVCSS